MLLFGTEFTHLTVKVGDFSKFSDEGMLSRHWIKDGTNYVIDNWWLNGKKEGNVTSSDVNVIMAGKANNEFKPYDNVIRGKTCVVLRGLSDRILF